jgi:hypothetical protein
MLIPFTKMHSMDRFVTTNSFSSEDTVKETMHYALKEGANHQVVMKDALATETWKCQQRKQYNIYEIYATDEKEDEFFIDYLWTAQVVSRDDGSNGTHYTDN